MPAEPTLTQPPVTVDVPAGRTVDQTHFADVPGPAGVTPAGDFNYDLEAELGRGGMGVVYRARQRGLNRLAAVKMVLGGERADPKQLIRFLAEAEAVAAVQSPHVVRVYDYGQTDGRPYLAMEYCDGGSLADRLAAGRMSPAAAADLMAKVADGVAAAHDQGIVHRDLKPANVLFDAAGEPKVTDFGLAKRGAGSDLTRTQAVMGTPAYMSPEQAKGQTKFVGPPADVWALGVTLYELLAGRRPFADDDTWALLKKVMTAEPAGLRTLSADVPRDLDLICRKCLAKEPHERYATARELADDLRAWREGRPISARQAGAIERAAKWVRRNKLVTGSAAAVFFALTVGAGVATLQWRRAEQALVEITKRERETLAALAKADLRHGQAQQFNGLGREVALASYTSAIQRWEQLRLDDPSRSDFAIDLATAYVEQGEVLQALGKTDEADTALRNGMTTWEQIPGLDSPRTEHAKFIDAVLATANTLRMGGRESEAVPLYDRVIRLMTTGAPRWWVTKESDLKLYTAYCDRAACLHNAGRFEGATSDYESAEALPENLRGLGCKLERLASKLRTAQWLDALCELDTLDDPQQWEGKLYFTLTAARAYATASRHPTTRHEVYADKAMKLLQFDAEYGFLRTVADFNVYFALEDFDPLRKRADFRSLERQLTAKSKPPELAPPPRPLR